MTTPPAASMRAAAAITSITMKGGTSLRPDAVRRPLARSLSVASSIDICYLSWCPRLAAFHGLVGHIAYPACRQSFKNHHVVPPDAAKKSLKTDRRDRRGGACHCADGSCACTEGEGSAGDPRHRGRATVARLHAADHANRWPGKAEHSGRDHQ